MPVAPDQRARWLGWGIIMDNQIDIHAMKKLLHPAVAIWLLFSLICVLIVSRAQFTADMSAFLPRDPSPRQQILIDQISEGFASRALIVGIEGAPSSVLAQMSLNLGQQLRGASDFSSVSNGQMSSSQKDHELLLANRYVLSPAMGPERMTVNGLRLAIEESLAEVGSSTGLFSKALLHRDPTGELLEVLKRVIPASQPSQVDGVWMNAAKTRALLLLQTRAQGSDLDAQEAAHALIRRSFADAQSKVGPSAAGTILKFSGPGVFAVSSRDTIRTEAARLSAIGTALVLCLLWLIYRSFFTLFLGIIPVASGAIAGVAAVALGFPAVHAMTLGFGITLMGEAVDYAIYLFMQHTRVAGENPLLGLERAQTFSATFWPTIRLGVLTSVFGFSTLLLSGFMGLAQLGLFTIAGIVVAALVTRFVLPVLLPQNFWVSQPVKLGVFLGNAVKFLGKLKVLALVLTGVAAVTLAMRWGSVWSVELGGLSPVPEAAQKLETDLRADMGAADAGALMVIKASSSELALQRSEQISSRLMALVDSGELGGFESPTIYLPSLSQQLQRQAALPDDAELKRRTSLAVENLPLKTEKLEEFFADIARAKTAKPLTRADLDNTSFSLGVDALLMQASRSPNAWTALIVLKPPQRNGAAGEINLQTVNAALTGLSAEAKAGTYLVQIKTEASNLYQAYLREAIGLSAGGFVAIIVLLLVSLRSLSRVVRVVLPLLAAIVIVAAGVVLFKGSLSLLHLVGLLLVIAVGSNYALFFDQRSKNSMAANSAGRENNVLCSLLFANLTTVLGFGLLAFSSVPVMSAIGLTVGAGTFLALVLSAIFSVRHRVDTIDAG
jgi:predicted exporter